MKCPDCKDGFYYPLIGPPEPCLTCQKSIQIQPLGSFSHSFSPDSIYKDRLLDSIKEIGLINPIKVKLGGGMAYVLDGKYRIAAFRRWCLEDTDSFLERFPDYQIPVMEIS